MCGGEPSSSSRTRVVVTNLILAIWFSMITYKMFNSLKEYGVYNNTWVVAGCIGVTIIGGLMQIYVFVGLLSGEPWEYCNFSNLIFILSTFIQYGVGIHHSHLNARKNYSDATIIAGKGCTNLENDYSTYIIYLSTLPMLIVTNMIYPYPEDKKTSRTTLLNGLNMLDFIDMADLMFTDLGCYQTYPKLWLALFYFALGISVILTAFSNGIERKETDTDINNWDYLMTGLNMVFNDGLFFVLRVYTMVQAGHVYFGLIFVIKEFLSFAFRLGLILCGNY